MSEKRAHKSKKAVSGGELADNVSSTAITFSECPGKRPKPPHLQATLAAVEKNHVISGPHSSPWEKFTANAGRIRLRGDKSQQMPATFAPLAKNPGRCRRHWPPGRKFPAFAGRLGDDFQDSLAREGFCINV